MNGNDIELPSNKKFGFFWSIIFILLAIYYYLNSHVILIFIAIFMSITFCLITTLCPERLMPLNKLWMQLGYFLGMIINPFVLGILFFTVFTSLGIIMRIFGRDELHLRMQDKPTYWVNRDVQIRSENFKNQF